MGDLLRHFPRRYVQTGRLTTVSDLVPGQMLTVVGEIVRSEVRSYSDRRTGKPAFRLETLLSTDGPALKMTFFAKHRGTAEWRARSLAVGTRGLFVGQVSSFRDAWQLTNPKMVLFGAGEDDADGEASWINDVGDWYPIYPLTKGVESWDLQRAVAFALSVLDELPEVLPDSVRDEHDVLELRQAFEWVHAPAGARPGRPGAPPLPLRGGAGHPAGAGPSPDGRARRWAPARAPAAAACWRPSTPGCPSCSPPASARSGRRSRRTSPRPTR